jgi:hypothetical protein
MTAVASQSEAGLQIAAGHFGIETRSTDGRAYCKTCNQRVMRPFRVADLAEVLTAIRLHRCPKRTAGLQL